MARKKSRSRARNGKSNGNGVALFDELSVSAFSRAFHSHIEELSYEMLKDPEYQEWMKTWLEGFLEMSLRKLRASKTKNPE